MLDVPAWLFADPEPYEEFDLAQNPMAMDLLHGDLANVGHWFSRHGAGFDVDAVFSGLVDSAFG